jgi:hypothetical protein
MFSYFMCAYIVLKFNNKYSLLFFFHISCVLILVLKFNNKYSLIIMCLFGLILTRLMYHLALHLTIKNAYQRECHICSQ